MPPKFHGYDYQTEDKRQVILQYLYKRAQGITGLNPALVALVPWDLSNPTVIGFAAIANELQRLFIEGRKQGVVDLELRVKGIGAGLLGAFTELLATDKHAPLGLLLLVESTTREDEIVELAALAMASQGLCEPLYKPYLQTSYQKASTAGKRLAIATVLVNQFDEIEEFEKEIKVQIISNQGLDELYNVALTANRGAPIDLIKVAILKEFMLGRAIEFVVWGIAKAAI